MRIRPFILAGSALALAIVGILAIITQPFVKPFASQAPAVDPVRLEEHVRHLSVDLYPRSFDQAVKIERAAQYILTEFRKAGCSPSVQDVLVQEAKYKNIVVKLGPATGPVLVMGAHYDSHGNPEETNDPRGYAPDTHTPGADDNASGVAGLIELGRLLCRSQPAQPIELVAYTLEEPPHFRSEHMGSAWHARALRANKRDVRLMLSLEMIGYFSDEPGSQDYPVPGMTALYPDRGNYIALVGKLSDFDAMRHVKAAMAGATDLPIYSINAPTSLQGVDFSDHLSYWNRGFPALMVTDTSFMRNRNYHLASDTYEKLDYKRMAKVVQAVYAVARSY